jgi:hypothetical protein
VLPGVDGTLASEVCSLLSAYDALKLPAGRPAKASDHFVWLKPYRPKKDALKLYQRAHLHEVRGEAPSVFSPDTNPTPSHSARSAGLRIFCLVRRLKAEKAPF